MFVAMPTAMPVDPLMSRLGNRDGITAGLPALARVIVDKVDRILVDAVEQVHRKRGEACLGVAHRSRRIVDSAEVCPCGVIRGWRVEKLWPSRTRASYMASLE